MKWKKNVVELKTHPGLEVRVWADAVVFSEVCMTETPACPQQWARSSSAGCHRQAVQRRGGNFGASSSWKETERPPPDFRKTEQKWSRPHNRNFFSVSPFMRYRYFTAFAHTLAQSRPRTGSYACDVRLEFGVESQVDEGSKDLHPPPDTSHKYYRGWFEERAALSYIASCFYTRFHLWEYH